MDIIDRFLALEDLGNYFTLIPSIAEFLEKQCEWHSLISVLTAMVVGFIYIFGPGILLTLAIKAICTWIKNKWFS